MTKHTQGPWHCKSKPAIRYPVVYAGRNTRVARAVTRGLPEDEIEANINLISSAPVLLEALEVLYTQATQGFIEDCHLNQAMDAINKAKGL